MTTRGERMLALRRARMEAAPPFLRGGFRPFFLAGSLWAVIALMLWLLSLAGILTLPSAMAPLVWHRHEMLFGFVGAVIAGFLLTAIPNWTGRLPIAGLPLIGLSGLWLLARLAVLFSARTGAAVAAALDIGFYLLLAGVAGREVLAAKNRNRPVVLVLVLLAVADAADHAASIGWTGFEEAGILAGVVLVVLLISLIGGRIVPSFTRNWMVRHGIEEKLPAQPNRFDAGVIAATAAAVVAWIVAPAAPLAGGMLIAAGLLQAARLLRWGGMRTVRDPLVFILHVGYAWVPVGLLLLGGSVLSSDLPRSAAIHALTAGAMGTMILAVMTRATLGHTGRAMKAGPATILAYVAVSLGAILRVAASAGLIDYDLGIEAAGTLWAIAFLIFIAAYGPALLRPRSGEA